MNQPAALTQADDILALTDLLRKATYRLAGVLENAPQDALLLDPAVLEGADKTLRSVALVLSDVAMAGRAANGQGDLFSLLTQDERNDAALSCVRNAVDDADIYLV